MADNEILLKLRADASQLDKDLASVKDRIKKFEKETDQGSKPKDLRIFNTEKFESSLKSLSSKVGEFSPLLGQLGSSFSGLAVPVGLAGLAIAAFAKTTQEAFKLALSGEAEQAITKRFDILAEKAGLFPQALKQGIADAVGGTVDLEDALQKASQSLVELEGASSEQISNLFKLSRQTSEVFGGDVLGNVDKLSTAIASGSTKALKSLGIQVDLTKAQKDYATSLGISVEQLTQQEKQQANLNAVLAKGEQSFKGISAGGLTPLANIFQQLKVQIGDFGDSVAELANNLFGGVFKSALGAAVSGLTSLNQKFREIAFGEAPSLQSKIESLSQSIASIKATPFELSSPADQARLTNLQSQLNGLLAQQEREIANEEKLAQIRKTQANGTAPAEIVRDKTPEQIAKEKAALEEILKLRVKANTDIANQELENFKSRQALKQSEFVSEAAIISQRNLEEQIAAQTHQAKLAEIELQFSKLKNSGKLADQQLFNSLIEQENERSATANAAIQQRATDQLQNTTLSVGSGFGSFFSGFKSGMADLSKNASQNFSQIGKSAAQGLGQAAGAAFSKFGEALVSGEDALGAFASAFIGYIGDLAVQLGTSFLLQGIAWSLNPATPGSGAGLITAGAALATFGGVLKALSGKGGGKGSSASTASTAGGRDTSFAPIPGPQDQLTTNERNDPSSRVNVVIAGDVYDSDSTGERIAELIADATRRKGVVLNVA